MDYEFEKIKDLTRTIFRKSANVSHFTVKNVGTNFIIKIFNKKGGVTFGMQGTYDNVKKVCLLIIEEQKVNGGKLYEQRRN